MSGVVDRGAWRRRLSLAFVLGWMGLAVGLGTHGPDAAYAQPKPAGVPAPGSASLPGVALGGDHAVGAPTVVDNLTVFPIYAKTPEDLGEFTTLEAATERKLAVVREVGADAAASSAPGDGRGAGSAARVDTLVIENKGKVAILVLAGTVVKGGKQDRQIGEDFIIPAGKTVNVDAFCVEHGRWDQSREGKSTGGKFVAQKSLALGSVRAAGQHDKNQGQVWNEVARVNAGTKNDAPSGTLLATMDDKKIAEKRARMATQLAGSMATAPQQDKLVGVAYAVDGKVKAVRWFAGPKLFKLHQETLLQTAAMEAIAAGASNPVKGGSAPARAEAVASFVNDMEKQAVAERRAKSENVNSYKKGSAGYASETTMDYAPSPGAPAKPKSVSKDYMSR